MVVAPKKLVVQLPCAAVAYGELSSGEFRLFTRLGGILAIGAMVLRHKRHNRNIPTSSGGLSQIAIRNLYIRLESEPDCYVRSPGARPIWRASSNWIFEASRFSR
jgi:hypothetical protein